MAAAASRTIMETQRTIVGRSLLFEPDPATECIWNRATRSGTAAAQERSRHAVGWDDEAK